uniref:protein-tyrosine-phosphatase n=1 Tax=Denticeps clupeoides TaxID=299321 RepID=A0AAY4CNZ6_9TELE
MWSIFQKALGWCGEVKVCKVCFLDFVWTVMTASFRLPAGRNYNVRASELARDGQHSEVVCNVLLLDNTVQAFKVNKHDQGQVLLDVVFKHLELTERDYFGLQLADETCDSQRWLDPNKPIRKQLKRGSPHNLNFRVKFFVSDPNKLQEEYTRYLYFLQLKQDILTAELGDYSHSEHLPGYLSEYSFIPTPPQDFEKEITKLHQQHNGLSPAQSEFNYLNTARTLELYGVELHCARQSLHVLRSPVTFFSPSSFFSPSRFVAPNQSESRETLLGFNMVNYRACKNLWKACVEHHTFFRLDRPVPPQKNFFAHYFTLGSKSPSKPLVRKLLTRMDWESVSRNSLSDDRLETQSLPTRSPPGTPNQPCTTQHFVGEKSFSPAQVNGVIPHDNLVLIKMRPDENGRFGFNVKGGSDQKMPIIVSRVAPGTPADLCVPRLNEGDQVVLINGRDISDHTHDQVVMFIKASCEDHSGELILLVRPNGNVTAYLFFFFFFYMYIYCVYVFICCVFFDCLNQYIFWLFQQLYRKRPGMAMSCAKLPQNISKNRYRDISPYDATRVILKGLEDYINANYINMEVPASGLLNRYIACQGPLPNTCSHFWQMTWEQGSTMVVMLTTQVERGRVKCHQYWPNPSTSSTYGNFQVTCLSEEGNSAYTVREMTLTNIETNEERQITQIQYMAWPDHGVPDDSTDFLNFVDLVRSTRQGKDPPVVVHCSAGIGRTGVLITMETAMCLIECNQPVYPLDIVRTMRDQRAMMIQTPSQYRFVCEAILKVYTEEVVKPQKPPEEELSVD